MGSARNARISLPNVAPRRLRLQLIAFLQIGQQRQQSLSIVRSIFIQREHLIDTLNRAGLIFYVSLLTPFDPL
jgi:hypothetical protein